VIEARLDTEIPSPLSCRRRTAKKKRVDGPKTITEIRNKIVHPSPNNLRAVEAVGGENMLDAYTISMWYLELLLLFLLNYEGEYSNRLIKEKWLGETEPVPWHPVISDKPEP
jgi:hypothetical protein